MEKFSQTKEEIFHGKEKFTPKMGKIIPNFRKASYFYINIQKVHAEKTFKIHHNYNNIKNMNLSNIKGVLPKGKFFIFLGNFYSIWGRFFYFWETVFWENFLFFWERL
jgi:hypothetical protein